MNWTPITPGILIFRQEIGQTDPGGVLQVPQVTRNKICRGGGDTVESSLSELWPLDWLPRAYHSHTGHQ